MRAILMFHGVDESGSVLSVSVRQLRSLLHSITAAGHRIVPLSTLLEHPDQPDRVALTFDDGFESVARRAAPVLAEVGAPATLFLTTGYVGQDNRWPSQPPSAATQPMMDWDDVEELKRQGWDIQPHSVNHPDLRTLSDDQLAEELELPVEHITARLGHRPDMFAYPYGYLDARVCTEVGQRFRFAVTTTLATLSRPRPAHRKPRLDAFYLRDPAVHRFFGRRRFRVYLRARGAARRLRGHPGETG